MAIGIYCLQFEGTDKVYIGQSINIERRYTQHLRVLSIKQGCLKIQDAYNSFGAPKLLIVTEALKDELDILETDAIDLYNSYNNGFNSTRGGSTGMQLYGTAHGKSKYTYKQIIDSVNLMVDSIMSLKEISKITGVPSSSLSSICTENSHTWLSREVPESYRLLINTRGKHRCAKLMGIQYPPIISPEGIIYHSIPNVAQFAKAHGLHAPNLGAVLKSSRKSHKGWRIYYE